MGKRKTLQSEHGRQPVALAVAPGHTASGSERWHAGQIGHASHTASKPLNESIFNHRYFPLILCLSVLLTLLACESVLKKQAAAPGVCSALCSIDSFVPLSLILVHPSALILVLTPFWLPHLSSFRRSTGVSREEFAVRPPLRLDEGASPRVPALAAALPRVAP